MIRQRRISTMVLGASFIILYVSVYLGLRMGDSIIHGIHDGDHFMGYLNTNLDPFFDPLMFAEKIVHKIIG